MFVRKVRAFDDETVEIQWSCRDGEVFIERRTVPPKSTRDAAISGPGTHWSVDDLPAPPRTNAKG